MRQRKYFRTKNKNDLDIDSYSSLLHCRGRSNKQGGGCVFQKNILKWGRGDHNKVTLREYWDYTIKWGRGGQGFDNKIGGGGYNISAFNGNGQYTYITFGTDVFSIRKNVRKWIESQIERFVRMFCFEVKIHKYSTKEIFYQEVS